MKIILIHKDEFPKRPPVISSTLILAELGHNVTLVTEGLNEYWKEKLHNHKIEAKIIANKYKKYGRFGKVLAYRNFKKEVLKIAEEEKKQHGSVLLWIEGAQTIVALGSKVNEYPHILQIQELHETSKMQLKAIAKVINTAKVVFMPEYNRTILYQIWFELRHRPIVLPNKPFFYLSNEDIEKLETKYAEQLAIFKKKKVILYQGQIAATRDLSNYVKAVKNLGSDFCMVLVGKDHNMVSKYKSIDENLVHINFIPAPDYLLFTSMAYIGILTYNPDSLNNMYCAPNKIYEYSKYSLPMLGNDIPGLKYAIEPYNAGVIVDEDSVESIEKGIIEIDNQYEKFKANSTRIYTEQDNMAIIKNALKDITL